MKKSVKGNLLKASVLLIALQDVGAGATTPALGAIGAAFPNVSPTVIQNIATLPALFMVVFGLLYGPMTKMMNKRTILYVAAVCFLGGGIVPAFLNDIYIILGFRALVGVGVGLLYPLANDLIVDFWEGDERRKLIGYAFAVGMLGGVLFQIIGGVLSDINWHYTFYAYAVAAVFFIIPLIFLPEPAKKQDMVKGTSQEKAKVPPRQYGLCLLNTLWCICFTTIVANGAMVIVGEGIGTGSQIGVVFSVMTGGAFVGGILFGKLNKILGSFSLLYCYWGTAAGMYVFYVSHSLGMIFVAMFIIGFVMGYAGSNFFNKSTDISPFAVSAMAVALISAFNGFGQFISPFIMNPLVSALGLAQGRPAILVGTIGLVVLGIIAFFFDKATPKIAESEKPQIQIKIE